MNKIILQILAIGILGTEIGFSQSEIPFYEQIAFDYYQTEILTEYQTEKRISVFAELKPVINLEMLNLSMSHYNGLFNNHYWWPTCNENFISDFKKTAKNKKLDNLKNNLSNIKKLNLSDLDKNSFRIKKYGKGKFPKLYIDQSISIIDSELTIVNINLIERHRGTIYHIQININGIVTGWCKTGYIE